MGICESCRANTFCRNRDAEEPAATVGCIGYIAPERTGYPVSSPAPWNSSSTMYTCPDCGVMVITDSPNEEVNENFCHRCGFKFKRGA